MTASSDPISTRVAGVTFDNRDRTPRQPFIRRIRRDDRLLVRREAENPYDANAIAVFWPDNLGDEHQIGYIPRSLAAVLAPLLDDGILMTALAIRAQKVPRGGIKGQPAVWGVRITLFGDFSALPASRLSGLEPAIQHAVAQDEERPEPGYAPVLGGDRARPSGER